MSSQREFVAFLAPAPQTQSEIKRRKHQLARSDVLIAVKWLNAAKGTAPYRRVLNIRQELEDLGTSLVELRKRSVVPEPRGCASQTTDELKTLRVRFRERHNALNQILSHYVYVPALAYVVETGLWHLGMVPKIHRDPQIKIEDQDLIVRVSEPSAVVALARLAANGELNKVRLCAHCHDNWFFSLRNIDRFCSAKCRISFHVQSEEGKLRHRKAQQRYRGSPGLRSRVEQ